MRVTIERLETSTHGTFGRIHFPGGSLFTGELPDHDNAPNVSRIPAGRYRVAWTFSPAFKRFMYLVLDVPRRSGIRIHSANLMGIPAPPLRRQLHGCISLGERLGMMDGQKAVLLSAPAVRRFESAMSRNPFDLEILECSPL
jgi:hypothetical protein